MSKPDSVLHYLCITSLIGLIVLSLAWEGWLTPLRPGGSLLTLKALPLLVPLFGILRGKIYTYQWSSMLILLYFTEGVVRLYADKGLSSMLAGVETGLSVVFFVSTVLFVRSAKIRQSAI
jgi:uncharacterized membrane protein